MTCGTSDTKSVKQRVMSRVCDIDAYDASMHVKNEQAASSAPSRNPVVTVTTLRSDSLLTVTTLSSLPAVSRTRSDLGPS